MKNGYVYIITNTKNGVLYTSVTSNLLKRLYQHKNKLIEGFSKKYNLDKLVYYEEFIDIKDAIEREKIIKGKKRTYKIELIESINPNWNDLSREWF